MAYDAGGIEYNIDMDTSELLTGEKAASKSIKNTTNEFKKLDAQAKKTQSSFGGIGRSAGQAGIQVQQFIGQIQGGQSAMLALSQQSADLGFVLGAPLLGAVVGISASLAGIFLPSLIDSEEKADLLKETLESLDRIVKQSKDGVNVLSSEFAKLAQVSESVAKAQLALSITEANKALELTRETALENVEAFDTWLGTFNAVATVDTIEEINGALDRTGWSVEQLVDNFQGGGPIRQFINLTEELGDELGLTAEESLQLVNAVKDLKVNANPQSLNNLAEVVTDLSLNSAGATNDLKSLAVNINELNLESQNAESILMLLEKAFADLSKTLDSSSESSIEYRDKLDSLIQSLQLQADTVGMTKVQVAEYRKEIALSAAATLGASEAELELIALLNEKIIASERAAQADRNRAAAARAAAQAERESKEASKSFVKGFGIEGEEDALSGGTADSEATAYSRQILSENETLLEALERRREMIELFQEWEIGSAEAHAQALEEIAKQEASEERRIMSERLSAGSDFFGASADLIGAFAGESSNAYKALFAVSKGFAIANAALQLQTAIANASALPWPANLAAITQAATLGASIASNVASITYSGGARQFGGGTSPGSMYAINETGAPEVRSYGGKDYLMETQNAKVTPLDKMGGGGVSVQIVNEPGVRATVVSENEKQVIIRTAIEQMDNKLQQDIINGTGKAGKASNQVFGQGNTRGIPQ